MSGRRQYLNAELASLAEWEKAVDSRTNPALWRIVQERYAATLAEIDKLDREEIMANPALAHDVYEKMVGYDPDDPDDVYDHPVIITCRKCKRVLAVDDTLRAPEEYGICTPIPADAKVTKLVV